MEVPATLPVNHVFAREPIFKFGSPVAREPSSVKNGTEQQKTGRLKPLAMGGVIALPALSDGHWRHPRRGRLRKTASRRPCVARLNELIPKRLAVTNAAMKILAIDTALPAVSACVLTEGAVEAESEETMGMDRGHAEALIPLIERVVGRIDGGFSALDRVAVTVGPGSFTGLRVGISAARAIALACSIPAVGVSTLAALAAPLILDEGTGTVVVAVDARHGHVFFASFRADGSIHLMPRFASKEDAIREIGEGPLRLAGSGAPLLAIEAWQRGVSAEIVGDRITPDIVYVARLGLLANPASAPPRPLYLKAPDAKPQAPRTPAKATEPA